MWGLISILIGSCPVKIEIPVEQLVRLCDVGSRKTFLRYHYIAKKHVGLKSSGEHKAAKISAQLEQLNLALAMESFRAGRPTSTEPVCHRLKVEITQNLFRHDDIGLDCSVGQTRQNRP